MTRTGTPRRPTLEALEARDLLAGATAQLDGTILRVVGTADNDRLAVVANAAGTRILVREDDVTIDVYDWDDIDLIVLDGGAGDDALAATVAKPAIVVGGDGGDALTGDPAGPTAFVTDQGGEVERLYATSYLYNAPPAGGLTHEGGAALGLVPYGRVDALAVASGRWDARATWFAGLTPEPGADVLIPKAIRSRGATRPVGVTVAAVVADAVRTVRVDGALSLTGANAELTADTVVVAPGGRLTMNAELANTRATLRIQNDTSLAVGSEDADHHSLSQGLVVLGTADLRGRAKAPYLMAASVEVGPSPNGPTRLVVAAGAWRPATLNWRAGDRIVLPAGTITSIPTEGEGGNRYETEAANEVMRLVRAPEYDRGRNQFILTLERGDLRPGNRQGARWVHRLVRFLPGTEGTAMRRLALPITNLTRSAVVRSVADTAAGRGHVMFMETRDVTLHFAGFENLGRTDKSVEVTDGGANPRGRYAVHFHHAGVAAGDYDARPLLGLGALGVPRSARLDYGLATPIQVVGSVVSGGPGWGFVNHGSFVRFDGNVAHDVNGAGFVAEDGNETGAYTRNVAVGITTSATTVLDRKKVPVTRLSGRKDGGDFAFTGDGFWFQTATVRVEDNVAVGVEGNGYVYFTFDSPKTTAVLGSALTVLDASGGIPATGEKAIYAQATAAGGLRVRIFDDHGKRVVDADQGSLTRDQRDLLGTQITSYLENPDRRAEIGPNLVKNVVDFTYLFDDAVNTASITAFRNNVAVAVDKGLSIWKHHMFTNLTVANPAASVIQNLTVVNAAHNGVELSYVSGVTFDGATLVNTTDQKRNGQATYGFGLVDVNAVSDLTYWRLNVRGFKFGLVTVPTGAVAIGDPAARSYFRNDTDLLLTTNRGGFNFVPQGQWSETQTVRVVNVQLDGDVAVELQAGTLPLDPNARTPDGSSRKDQEVVDPFGHLFAPTEVTLRDVAVGSARQDGRLFFGNQARDAMALLGEADWDAQEEAVVDALDKMGIIEGNDRTGSLFVNDMAYFAEYREQTNGDLAGRERLADRRAYGGFVLDADEARLPTPDWLVGGYFLTPEQERRLARTPAEYQP